MNSRRMTNKQHQVIADLASEALSRQLRQAHSEAYDRTNEVAKPSSSLTVAPALPAVKFSAL